MDLRGKNILVTGGSRGIGRAIVRAFAQKGCNVLINYLTSESLARELLDDIKEYKVEGYLYKADVSSPPQVEKMFLFIDERLGNLDILVNNAGWTEYIDHKNLEGLSPELFSKIININLTGVYLCSAAAVKMMKNKKTESAIINIGSTAAFAGMGSNIAYCAAKAGVVNMTKAFARAFGPKIRINCIAPGLTDTDMTQEKVVAKYKRENILKSPLRRIAIPNDIARVAVALAEDMDFVNGQTIIVDGGKILNG